MTKLLVVLFALVAVAAAADPPKCSDQLPKLEKCTLEEKDLTVANCSGTDDTGKCGFLKCIEQYLNCTGDEKKQVDAWKVYGEAVNTALCNDNATNVLSDDCKTKIGKALNNTDVKVGVLPIQYATKTFLKEPSCLVQKLALYQHASLISDDKCKENATKFLENFYKNTNCDGDIEKPKDDQKCPNALTDLKRKSCFETTDNRCNDTFYEECWTEKNKNNPCKVDVVNNYLSTAIEVAKKSVSILTNNKDLCEFFNTNKTCWTEAQVIRDRVIQEKRDAFTDDGLTLYYKDEYKPTKDCKDKVDQFKKLLTDGATGMHTISFITMAIVALMIVKLF